MNIRRFLDKIILTAEHAIFIWKNDICFDFDYDYLIKLIEYKIQRMYDFNSGKDACAVHSKKELRKMLSVINHFKRWYDMDKYRPYKGKDKIYPIFKISDKELKHILQNDKLESWHLQEAFRKIGKYITKWWD